MNRDPEEPSRTAREERLLSVILPSVIAIVMVALVLSESEVPSFELRVTAPSMVAPSAPVPVRAEVLAGMERPEGPSVVRVPVRAQIVDDRDRVITERALARSKVAGAEGTLPAPARAGRYRLVLVTSEAEGDMRAERLIEVARATKLESVPRRTVAPLPVLGPIESTSGTQPAPSVLELAVENGLCIPETPCPVYVRMGSPAAALHIEPGSTVSVARAPRPSEETGVVSAEVVVRGPEPLITLVAMREGAPVARRTVGLPAGRGGLRLVAGKRLLAPGEPVIVRIESFDGPVPAVIDLLRDGVWIGATSIDRRGAREGAPVALPREPGRYRLVARGDFVSNDASSSVIVAVGTEDTDPLRFAFDHAPEEASVVRLPPFTSAILQANTGAVQRRTARRFAAGFVILLCGAFASVRVARRVRAAGREARAIMLEAGDEAAESEAHVRRDERTARIVGSLVFLAFLFAALLVVSRSVL